MKMSFADTGLPEKGPTTRISVPYGAWSFPLLPALMLQEGDKSPWRSSSLLRHDIQANTHAGFPGDLNLLLSTITKMTTQHQAQYEENSAWLQVTPKLSKETAGTSCIHFPQALPQTF